MKITLELDSVTTSGLADLTKNKYGTCSMVTLHRYLYDMIRLHVKTQSHTEPEVATKGGEL
jgi:hypothetical protein